MKNLDEKMRQRFLDREDDRLLRKVDKEIRKHKRASYARTDKDEQEAEMIQRLLNIKAELEGR